MKKLTKLFALCLALALCLSLLPAAHGATAPAATIDTSRKASLDLYKYDFTSANEAGILEWDTCLTRPWKRPWLPTPFRAWCSAMSR